jgi:hypothetical protein
VDLDHRGIGVLIRCFYEERNDFHELVYGIEAATVLVPKTRLTLLSRRYAGRDRPAGRLCCIEQELARETELRSVSRSDDRGQFGERDRDAMAWVGFDPEFVVAPLDVLHERVAVHDHPRGMVPFEAAHRMEPRLQAAVV